MPKPTATSQRTQTYALEKRAAQLYEQEQVTLKRKKSLVETFRTQIRLTYNSNEGIRSWRQSIDVEDKGYMNLRQLLLISREIGLGWPD